MSARFATAFEDLVALIEGSLEGAPAKRRRLAIAAVAAEIGAIVVARAVAKADLALSDEVLAAARKTMVAASS